MLRPFAKGLPPAALDGVAGPEDPSPKLPNPAATPPAEAAAGAFELNGDADVEAVAAPNAGVAAAAVAAAPNPPKPEVFAGVANAPDAEGLDEVVEDAAAPNGDVVAADDAAAPNGDVVVAGAPPPAFSRSSFSASCALAYPALAFARNAELNPPVVAAGFASGVEGAEEAAPGDAGGETAEAAAVAVVAGAVVAGAEAAGAGAAAAGADANANVDAVGVDTVGVDSPNAAAAAAAVEAAPKAGAETAAVPDPNAGAVDAGSVNAGVEDALVVAPNENVDALDAAAAAKGDTVAAAAGFDATPPAAPAFSRSSCGAFCAAA